MDIEQLYEMVRELQDRVEQLERTEVPSAGSSFTVSNESASTSIDASTATTQQIVDYLTTWQKEAADQKYPTVV